MITVNQEQIDQAKIWEKKLAEGGCNLNDALYMSYYLKTRHPKSLHRQY